MSLCCIVAVNFYAVFIPETFSVTQIYQHNFVSKCWNQHSCFYECVKIRRLIDCDVIPLLYFMVNGEQFTIANGIAKKYLFVGRNVKSVIHSSAGIQLSKRFFLLWKWCAKHHWIYIYNQWSHMIHSSNDKICNLIDSARTSESPIN